MFLKYFENYHVYSTSFFARYLEILYKKRIEPRLKFQSLIQPIQ